MPNMKPKPATVTQVIISNHFKGSLSPWKNENKLDKDVYCTLLKFVLMCFIQRNQGHRDSVKHEFSSNVNKVNKTVVKVRKIGDRLPLILYSNNV